MEFLDDWHDPGKRPGTASARIHRLSVEHLTCISGANRPRFANRIKSLDWAGPICFSPTLMCQVSSCIPQRPRAECIMYIKSA